MRLDFKELNQRITPPDKAAMADARAHWDSIAKPLNGLGHFEDMVVKIAGLVGDASVDIGKRAVVVLCADNGVVVEGVTQTDASVTVTMAEAIVHKRSSVCRMAATVNADVFPVDMGMLRRGEGVRDVHIANGTKNIAVGPAMTREEACRAIRQGIDLVAEYKAQGYRLLVTGEMGIGNTTTSSAVAAILLNCQVEEVTGRGAGLSDAGLCRKVDAIKRAIEINRPDPNDALDVLHKLGGFDIAGMVGLYLGGAIHRVPILIDGLISSVAALIAARLCPASVCAMLASHSSAEPAAEQILMKLGLQAVLYGGLKLGEGTGAVCLVPLLDMALSVYHNSAAFADTGIQQYEKLGGEGV